MINVSIDLSKIDKSKIKEGANGAKYYNITVDKRKDVDKFNNTHTVYQSQSKEEREAKTPKVYIGNGKEIVFNNNQAQQSAPQQQQQSFNTPTQSNGAIDDLPF